LIVRHTQNRCGQVEVKGGGAEKQQLHGPTCTQYYTIIQELPAQTASSCYIQAY